MKSKVTLMPTVALQFDIRFQPWFEFTLMDKKVKNSADAPSRVTLNLPLSDVWISQTNLVRFISIELNKPHTHTFVKRISISFLCGQSCAKCTLTFTSQRAYLIRIENHTKRNHGSSISFLLIAANVIRPTFVSRRKWNGLNVKKKNSCRPCLQVLEMRVNIQAANYTTIRRSFCDEKIRNFPIHALYSNYRKLEFAKKLFQSLRWVNATWHEIIILSLHRKYATTLELCQIDHTVVHFQ